MRAIILESPPNNFEHYTLIPSHKYRVLPQKNPNVVKYCMVKPGEGRNKMYPCSVNN